MGHKKVYDNSDNLLYDILQAANPTDMLSKCFDGLSSREEEDLSRLIHELQESGYITVNWANNKPYRVIINNSARIYIEEATSNKVGKAPYVNHQNLIIGSNNKITNSSIAVNIERDGTNEKNGRRKSFAEKHPVLISVLVSFVVGFILLFSFWKQIVTWIEGLF